MVCSESLASLHGHKYKVAHIVCSLICWLLPWIPVGIVLGSKTTSYNVVNMRVCFPNGTDTGFFTTTFITEVSQGVGCTCLFVVVYKLFMVSSSSHLKVSIPVLKDLLCLSSCYVFILFCFAKHRSCLLL